MATTDLLVNIQISTTRIEGEGAGAFTIYDVLVSAFHNNNESSCWTVSHRYSSFLELHTEITRQFPKHLLQEFPAKSVFEKSTNYDVVEKRKISLQKYLQGIVDNPLLRAYEPVLSFLFLRDFESTRRNLC